MKRETKMAMVLMALAACVSALLVSPAYAQHRRAMALKSGSVGVVIITKSDSVSIDVDIVFPLEMVRAGSKPVSGRGISTADSLPMPDLLVVDSTGVVCTLQAGKRQIPFVRWCENDDGLHVRPAFHAIIPRERCDHQLRADPHIDNIAAFVIVSRDRVPATRTPKHNPELKETLRAVRLEACAKDDGPVVARLVELAYEGMKGCGADRKQTKLLLQTAGGEYDIRCCEP